MPIARQIADDDLADDGLVVDDQNGCHERIVVESVTSG